MKDNTIELKTRSERAFALIERLLKDDLIKDEEIVTEMIGIIQSKVPGEIALEDRLATAELTFRAMLADSQNCLKRAAMLALGKNVTEAAIVLGEEVKTIGHVAVAALHVLGVPQDVAEREPSGDEIKRDEQRECNCEKCREGRVLEKQNGGSPKAG